MGSSSSKLTSALVAAVNNDKSLVAAPGKPFFQTRDVKRYNLAIPTTPIAVTYPRTAEEVSAIIKVAAASGLKVQARSGGHSYGNYGTSTSLQQSRACINKITDLLQASEEIAVQS
jgi:FAD/FMN-containing dehydrogenase